MTAVAECLGDELRLRRMREAFEPKQQNPGVHQRWRKTSSPKSLSAVTSRAPRSFLREDIVIYEAGRKLRDVEHIVTIRPKPFHYRTVDIFIGDDVHAVFVLIGYTMSARRACAAKRRAASTPSRVKRG